MFRIPPPYLWTPLSPQRVKGFSPLTIPKMRSKPKNASRFAKRIFLCFSHLRLRRRFHVSAGRYRQQRGNTSCEAANRRNEKKVQQRRPPPAADTGRSCWGRGQQDTSATQGTKWSLGTATRLSAATSFFPFRQLLRGLKGASSPFPVPAPRKSGAFLVLFWHAKENLASRNRALSCAAGAKIIAASSAPLHPPRESVHP